MPSRSKKTPAQLDADIALALAKTRRPIAKRTFSRDPHRMRLGGKRPSTKPCSPGQHSS